MLEFDGVLNILYSKSALIVSLFAIDYLLILNLKLLNFSAKAIFFFPFCSLIKNA